MPRPKEPDIPWEWLESVSFGEGDADSAHQFSSAQTNSTPAAGRDREVKALWPADVEYTNTVDWSSMSVGDEAIVSLCKSRLPGVQVRVITDQRHPCCGERGLFATRRWERCCVVGEYTGRVRVPETPSEISPSCEKSASRADDDGGGGEAGEYVAAVFAHATWTPMIDARLAGNETRFINDFRHHPRSTSANCRFSQTYLAGRPALLVVCTSDVEEGEEFLVDYGDHFWKVDARKERSHCERAE